MDTLSISLPCFLVSGLIVIVAGRALAASADDLAEQTRWGILWVGTMLVSVVTSLPELTANTTSVLIGSPSLALGNIFGSNMVNMVILSTIGIMFVSTKMFHGHGRDARTLAVAGTILGSIAIVASITGDIQIGIFSFGSILIAVAYVAGMRLVRTANANVPIVQSMHSGTGTLAPGLKFAISSSFIIAAAIVLAISADGISEVTGLGTSFMGVLSMAIVTSLPEASVAIAAAVKGSYKLAIATLYGSCCFNFAIIPIIDTLTPDPVIRAMDPGHLVASITATIFMGMGTLLLIMSERASRVATLTLLILTMAAYPLAIMWVFRLSTS
mgnify:CR=1 FL=1